MEETWYRHTLRVYYKDTDQMGVVHHGNYVNWFEIGRTEMMEEAGFAYHDIENMGLLLPVLHMDLNYHQSARYNELVAIYTKVGQFSPIRLQFDYEVRRVEEEAFATNSEQDISPTNKPSGELLVSGSTSHMWLNKKWKSARIDKTAPDIYALLQKIGSRQK
ncbi:acyl-CoA thioesterase [Lentibacillus daqui]|uniref:acyl-CoA thioesterase n=1 Tax=Lentibacillus daqui TaxID=2911514 RepID=UPI0022B0FCFF|nr:thioesterase family protein [Lentibacillus daqui]